VKMQSSIYMKGRGMIGANTLAIHPVWLYKQAVWLTFPVSWNTPSFATMVPTLSLIEGFSQVVFS
jgi:hypothetical protein